MITHLEGDSPTQPLINIEAIPLLNGPPHDVFCHGIWYDRLRPGCYKVYNCGVSDYFGVGHHRDGRSRGFDGVECEVISGHNTFFLQSVSAHLHVCPWTYLYGYYHLEPTLLTIQAFEAQLSYAPSEKFCSQRMLYSTILGISSAAVVQCVLVTRTHALYQQRWLTIFLGILGFLSISSAFILFSLVFRFETSLLAYVVVSWVALMEYASQCWLGFGYRLFYSKQSSLDSQDGKHTNLWIHLLDFHDSHRSLRFYFAMGWCITLWWCLCLFATF